MHHAVYLGVLWILAATTIRSATAFVPLGRPRPPVRLYGLLDNVRDFLSQRDGDFVKLQDSDKPFGPGPFLVAYRVPTGIKDDELQDMVYDTLPRLSWVRLDEVPPNDLTLQESLDLLASGKGLPSATSDTNEQEVAPDVTTPVLFFSGLSNPDMMRVYNLMANEIYLESQQQAACAKAVPNAMDKSLRQVLDEIASDHRDATTQQQQE